MTPSDPVPQLPLDDDSNSEVVFHSFEEGLSGDLPPDGEEIALEGDVFSPSQCEILKKLSAIMQEVPYVPHTRTVEFKGTRYQYAGEADLLLAIRSQFLAKGLVTIPYCEGVRREAHPSGSLTFVMMRYKIADINTGAFILIRMPGAGHDSTDKGIYKAFTGSYKYMLAKILMISLTGDDPEEDDPGAQLRRKAKANQDYAKANPIKGAKMVEHKGENPGVPTSEDMDPWDMRRTVPEDDLDTLPLDWWKNEPVAACPELAKLDPKKTVSTISLGQLIWAYEEFATLVDAHRVGYTSRGSERLALAIKERIRDEYQKETLRTEQVIRPDGSKRLKYAIQPRSTAKAATI